MFELTFKTSNAAFHDDDPSEDHYNKATVGAAARSETARILRQLANELESSAGFAGAVSGPVRDVNGNTVGLYELSAE